MEEEVKRCTFYEQASITEPDNDMAVNREFQIELDCLTTKIQAINKK
jgi:hypothetical protein